MVRHSVHVALLNRAVVEVRGDRHSARIAVLAGLLHDLDVESQPELDTHTRETAEILRGRGVDGEIIEMR